MLWLYLLCGWVVAGVLSYPLSKRRSIKCGREWLNRDVVFELYLGVLFGPISLAIELCSVAADLSIVKSIQKGLDAIQEWLDRPSG